MGSITSLRPRNSIIQIFSISNALILISVFILMLPAVALWSASSQIDGEVYTGVWITPSPTPIPPTLIAEKTAEGFYAEKDGMLIYGVAGEICVQNMGELPTEGLAILDTAQLETGPDEYTDLGFAAVDVSAHPVLEPGESYCYPYQIYFEPPAQADPLQPVTYVYRNKADVTILNHADWLPGGTNCPGPEACPYGPTVYAPFTLPEPTPTPTLSPEPTATFTETPTPDNQSGTTLEATKTAIGFQEYQEDILVTGVRGEICVTNGGEAATQNLTIVDTIEIKIDDEKYKPYVTENVDTSANPVIDPGESYCYPYEILFTLPDLENDHHDDWDGKHNDDDSDGPTGCNDEEHTIIWRNTAKVTITNHSGWLPGGHHCHGPEPCPFGPNPRADFEIPEPENTPTPVPVEPELTEEPMEEIVVEETPTETPTEVPNEEPSPTP